MTDEVVSIMDKNIEDLTTEDKAQIGMAVAATALVTAATVLAGLFAWKKFGVWRQNRKTTEAIAQLPS